MGGKIKNWRYGNTLQTLQRVKKLEKDLGKGEKFGDHGEPQLVCIFRERDKSLECLVKKKPNKK